MIDHVLREDLTEYLDESYNDRVVLFLRDSTQQFQVPVSLGKNKQGKEVSLPSVKQAPEQLSGTIVKATERVVHFRVKSSNTLNVILSAIEAAPVSRLVVPS